MQYASSKEVRRNVTVTLALLALLAFGVFRGIKEINQFRTFQESLPPSVQEAFAKLPFLKQVKLYNTVEKLGISPKVLEFYLNESARFGSSLAGLPLAEALRICSLVTRSRYSLTGSFYLMTGSCY